MAKNKKNASATGQVGTLEAAKDYMSESSGTKVQNANQNKDIHKEALGPNTHR